jgi:hypothetical protein
MPFKQEYVGVIKSVIEWSWFWDELSLEPTYLTKLAEIIRFKNRYIGQNMKQF